MAYLVWGHGTMYYLLSTRSTSADYGDRILHIRDGLLESEIAVGTRPAIAGARYRTAP